MAPNRENTERRVRVIESNTDFEEMQAGHIIPGADPPKNDHARGGFGDRDGRNGFGTDSSDGSTALSMNEDTEDTHAHTDGLQTMAQLGGRTATAAIDDDDDLADDDDLDDDLDVDEIPDDDLDADFDDTDFDDDADLDDVDLDEDFDEDDDDTDL
jgi:hypothetical protein